MLSYLLTGPVFADACSLKVAQKIRTLVPDCTVLSAFEDSFGQRELSPASIVLERRRVDFRFGNSMNYYQYDVFVAADEAARQLIADDRAFAVVSDNFETTLAKHFCQIAGAADAVRDGASFHFGFRFRLDGEGEAAVTPGPARYAGVTIHTCEAN
jgi:hypothetical protein